MHDWKKQIRRRLAELKLPPAREAEIIEELAQHMADDYHETRAAGASDEEAQHRVLQELADGALIRELLRAERPAREPMPAPEVPVGGIKGKLLGGLWQDVRYGLRMLRKNPAFTLVAVVTLALGIGANTATFSVLHALLIRPLPYRDAGRVVLVLCWDAQHNRYCFNVRMSEVVRWQEQNRSFLHIGAYRYWSANLVGVEQPERLQAYRVTSDMFELLGVEPLLGRTFRPEEGRPGAAGVVVLNYGVWQRVFGGDPQIVGRPLTLDDEPYTVVGVMPPKFEFPQFNYKGDLWVPMRFDPAEYPLGQPSPSVVGIARLRPEVTREQAQAEMDTLYARLVQEQPSLSGRSTLVLPMQELFARNARPILWTLMAAVGFVLLIACANVANLLVGRALGREREVAIRAAVGASRGRLVRQLLTESVLLGLAGGAVGVLLARWAADALRAAAPSEVIVTTPAVLEIGLNPAVLAFALGAAIVTGLLFGLAPAWRVSRTDLSLSLKEGGHVSTGRRRQRLGQALVVAEVALSLVLLTGAGLLLRSLSGLLHASPGFDPENVLVTEISLPRARYPDEPRQAQFFEQILERAASLPGVEAVGVVNRHPFSTSNTGTGLVVRGRPAPAPADLPGTDYREVSPDYFRVLRIPLVAGRALTAQDSREAERVVVINRTLAQRHFPGEDPVGQQIRLGGANSTSPWRTIVGIVGDIRHWSLRTPVEPEVYVPLAQNASPRMTVLVRTAGDPLSLAAALRAEVRAVDPNQPVYNVEPMVETVRRSMLPDRFSSLLMALFAGLALVLAAVGTYGVMSYAVTQRWHEIGMRVALGAQRGDILRLVVGQGMKLVVLGVALGLAGALGVMRFLRSLLFGIGPGDTVTFVSVTLLLAGVAFLACYIPARRATRVDPLVALRYE